MRTPVFGATRDLQVSPITAQGTSSLQSTQTPCNPPPAKQHSVLPLAGMLDPHNNGKAVASSAIATEIVKNFESLVRKSSRLFGSLRDLPQFGKYWSNHFQKTFEVYTKVFNYCENLMSVGD